LCVAAPAAGLSAVASAGLPLAAVSAALSSSASSVPTFTVVPSGTAISRSTPASGAGTSVSTLSVVTSSSASYFSTRSPGRFSHLPIVPSVTLSPSFGMVISVGICSPIAVHCWRAQPSAEPYYLHVPCAVFLAPRGKSHTMIKKYRAAAGTMHGFEKPNHANA